MNYLLLISLFLWQGDMNTQEGRYFKSPDLKSISKSSPDDIPSNNLIKEAIPADHEFHMSKCEIAFNEEEKALQIILHLFIDDLESALAEEDIKDLYICTDKEVPEAEQHIANYLEQTFSLEVNGKDAAYSFLGKEVSEDLQAVWCYLEIIEIESLQELSIKNQILTNTFDDQKNIVSITSAAEGRKGYFLFDKETFEDTVQF